MSEYQDHFQYIYANRASLYDRLVSREDYEGNLCSALRRIRPLEGLVVVEFGAGTGRLTRLLASEVKSISAFDISPHMLATARLTLKPLGTHWQLAVADNRDMPVGSKVADLAIAGWTFAHGMTWYGNSWQEQIGKMISEMLRVLKPGGTAIVIETMGTGNESPEPPKDYLATYYRWLESDSGFSYTWIRTDYRFESAQEADELVRFFFGDELASRVLKRYSTILPECTGIWWKHV